ncbi:hypothetical protein [uncultured Amnibacterium sp.]|uniref:hypothetical protein n=1 Tax=uncultured Amnibacterium sp. TaxID=1631851 RepID=UPI0035CC549F
MADAMCELRAGTLQTEFGLVAAQLVHVQSRTLAIAVLTHVWEQYDLLASALLAWMVDAGDDGDEEVRLRIAAAAGKLGALDFQTVYWKLLRPWTDSPSADSLVTAARALGLPATIPGVAPIVLRLLSTWSKGTDSPELQAVSALAYGGPVGLSFPAASVRTLCGMADAPDFVTQHIISGVYQLFFAGGDFEPDMAAVVLTELARIANVRTDDHARRAAAIAAYIPILRTASSFSLRYSSQAWRLLSAPNSLAPASLLIRIAWYEYPDTSVVVACMRRIVRRADLDPDAFAKTRELLVGGLTQPGSVQNDRDRLRSYLAQWSTGPDKSVTAKRILAEVESD